jgi:hypothetical protein
LAANAISENGLRRDAMGNFKASGKMTRRRQKRVFMKMALCGGAWPATRQPWHTFAAANQF